MGTQSIPKLLAYYRDMRGLTYRALAAAADCSPTTVHKIERGEVSPTVSVLTRILDALEVPEDERAHLLGGG